MPGDDRRTFLAAAAAREGQALILALGGSAGAAGRGAGAGRDRRGGDREGEGAAGGRPGGDLGGASMRDDLPRLLSPPALPGGLPNPAHIEKTRLPGAGASRGIRAGGANEVARPLRVSFPDQDSFAPVQAGRPCRPSSSWG